MTIFGRTVETVLKELHNKVNTNWTQLLLKSTTNGSMNLVLFHRDSIVID